MYLIAKKGTIRVHKGCSTLSRVAYAHGAVTSMPALVETVAAWWFERCAVRFGAYSILLPHASEMFPSSAMEVQDLAISHPWSLDRCSHAAIDEVEVESREWGVGKHSRSNARLQKG